MQRKICPSTENQGRMSCNCKSSREASCPLPVGPGWRTTPLCLLRKWECSRDSVHVKSGGKAASMGMCTATISLRNSNQNLKGVCDQSLSCVRLFLTSQTVACQAPLSMGFSRQEYRSGWPCPSPSKGRGVSKSSTERGMWQGSLHAGQDIWKGL